MKGKGIKAAALGVGIAGLGIVPTAAAHHSEPYCKYGTGVLPDNVTVEYNRWGEGCNGLKVTVDLGDRLVILSHGRSETSAHSEQASAEPSRSTEPSKKPKKRCKKRRKGGRCGRA